MEIRRRWRVRTILIGGERNGAGSGTFRVTHTAAGPVVHLASAGLSNEVKFEAGAELSRAVN